MPATNPSKLVAELGNLIGIPALAITAQGTCELMFDRSHLVTLVFVPALDKLVVSCPCRNPRAEPGQAALWALRANFMGCGTCGGSFALGSDDRLHLQFQLPLAHLSAELVMSTIENLLNGVESWAARGPARTATHQADRSLALSAGLGAATPR